MRDAAHTADARDERLTLPLRLAACVALDDALLTSPAVVGGRVYVVDQMGAAYCVDAQRAAIVWKTQPSGSDAAGGNTSSPCVANGKVAYGTTSGNFYLLDAKTGKTIRTIQLNQPVLGGITTVNGRYYLQTLDGVIHCLDESDAAIWRFDPYINAPLEPGSRAKRQYCGVPVAVHDDTVVAAVGFDLVCLRDRGTRAAGVWLKRTPITDTYLPVGVSLAGEWAYASFPGKDGKGAVVRIHLATGDIDERRDVLENQWAVLTPPATRDGLAYYCQQAFGVSAATFGDRPSVEWSSFTDQPRSATPAIAAPTLAGEYCLFTRLSGSLAIARVAEGNAPGDHRVVQTVAIPGGAVVTTSPVVSDGVVYFGSDDGCLYILRHEEGTAPASPKRRHSRRHRSEVRPAGDQTSSPAKPARHRLETDESICPVRTNGRWLAWRPTPGKRSGPTTFRRGAGTSIRSRSGPITSRSITNTVVGRGVGI